MRLHAFFLGRGHNVTPEIRKGGSLAFSERDYDIYTHPPDLLAVASGTE